MTATLTQAQSERLVSFVVELADRGEPDILVAAFAQGFLDGVMQYFSAIGTVLYDGDREYVSAYIEGWYAGKELEDGDGAGNTEADNDDDE